jgi:RNA exonuclease 4
MSDDGASISDSSSSLSSSSSSSPHQRFSKKKKEKHSRKQPRSSPWTKAEEASFVAMDCEMVAVGNDGLKSAVARVTCVDYNHNILLDLFVRPDQPVTDYRTHVSGITPQHLESEQAVDLETARSRVVQLLTPIDNQNHIILVGHALKNDLRLLNIQHPWQNIRDTAKYEPFMKVRFVNDGILWPRKLKELCQEHLDMNIQIDGRPHSAYEDAVAALELYKSVATKWEKVMTYKISKTAQIESIQQNHQQQQLFTAEMSGTETEEEASSSAS